MPRLITIPVSHFCEKARWALEHAGIPYVEEGHLPFFSIRAVRRAGGRRSVPVLVTDEGTIGGGPAGPCLAGGWQSEATPPPIDGTRLMMEGLALTGAWLVVLRKLAPQGSLR